VYTGFWRGHLRASNHFETPGLNRKIILKLAIKKWVGRAWNEFIWLRIRTGGGQL
jgi:hypothetical protein